MSCSRGVDKRLVLADTLMWTRPDSSLAILEAINRDSLQGEENLAYYRSEEHTSELQSR